MLQKILIVDDSEAAHTLVRTRLESEPVVVRSAYDGMGALAAARLWRPDLILLDVDLPDASGFDVCHWLQEDPLTRHVAIVFVSFRCEIEDKIRALESGACDYITKPFSHGEFKARIRATLRTQSRLNVLSSNRVRSFIAEPFVARSAVA